MADSSTTVQKVSAEVIGTFVLVFFGCGTAIFSGGDYTAIGLAFGLTVLVGAYAFGRISGAHFNPAVSVGAAMGGRMAWRQVPVYIGSQLVGGLVAGLLLLVLVHGFPGYNVKDNGLAQNGFGAHGPAQNDYHWWAAFILELVMTAVFLWVILAVTDERFEHPAMAPAAIGLTLSMIHFASIGADGTSVNPARSIGVGVFAGSDAIVQLWLFILAPLIGGALAGITYPLIFGHGAAGPVPGSGLVFARRPAAAVPGYGAPDQFQQEWNQQGYAAQQAHEQAWAAEPIIQDGWQWDHAAQEWKPLEQWQPAQPGQAVSQETHYASPPAAGEDTAFARPDAGASAAEPTQIVPPDPGVPDPHQPPPDQHPPA